MFFSMINSMGVSRLQEPGDRTSED